MLRRSLIVVRKNVSQESAKANQYIGRLKINLLQKAAMVFSRGDGRASSRSFQPPAEGRRKSTLSGHGIVICSSSVGIAESQAKVLLRSNTANHKWGFVRKSVLSAVRRFFKMIPNDVRPLPLHV